MQPVVHEVTSSAKPLAMRAVSTIRPTAATYTHTPDRPLFLDKTGSSVPI